LYKVERPGFRSDFPFFYRHVIRRAAAESWITVNRVAYFEFRDVCPRLLHNASDVVARNQRQMRSEFLGVFPAQRYRVRWVYAACDHAHERFIVRRLWPRHMLKLEHFGRAVFVSDYRSHRWLFLSARYAD